MTKKGNWLKNFGKSVKYTGIDIINEMVPNTAEVLNTAKGAKESAKDFKSFFTSSKSSIRLADKEINRSEISRKAKEVFKSAKRDIKNGNFSMENIKKKSSKDNYGFDSDDFSMDFLDSDSDNESGGSSAIINNISTNNEAIIDTTRISTEVISNTTLKSADITVKGINAVSLSGFMKLNESLMQTNSYLSNIDSNISQLVTFHSDNTAITNQAIMDTLQLVKDDLESRKKKDKYEDPTAMESIFGFGGLNLGAYANYVKKNVKDLVPLDMMQMMNEMSSGPSMFKNPVQFLFKQGLKMTIPSKIKKSMTNLDEAIPKLFRRKLMDLYDSDSLIGAIAGSVFGVKPPELGKVKLGDYYKDSVNWDGKSKKALEEVIPNLLDQIARNTSKDGSYKGKTFDYDTGRFLSDEDLDKKFKDKIQSSISSAYFDMIDRVENIFSSSINLDEFSEDKKKKIKSGVNKAFSDIMVKSTMSAHKKGVNLRSKKSVDSVLNNGSYDNDTRDVIYKILGQFTSKDIMDYDDQIISSKDTINEFLKDISGDKNSSSIYRRMFIDGDKNSEIIKNMTSNMNLLNYLEESKKKREEEMDKNQKIQKKFFDQYKKVKKRFSGSSKGGIISGNINRATDKVIDFTYNRDVEYDDDLRNMTEIQKRFESSMRNNSSSSGSSNLNQGHSSNIRELERNMMETENMGNIQNAIIPVVNSTQNAMEELSSTSGEIKSTFKQGVNNLYSLFLKPTYDAIFGKNGFISRMWNNDRFKSIRDKMKKFFFGEKGDDRVYRNGLFSGVANTFLDGIDYMKYVFTGKGYTSRSGKTYKDNKDSVWSNIKKGVGSAYRYTMQHFFGEDYKNNKMYQKTFGAVGRFFSGFRKNKKSSNVRELERNMMESQGPLSIEDKKSSKLKESTKVMAIEDKSMTNAEYNKDLATLNKYKKALGEFHPDNFNGNENYILNKQYSELLKQYSDFKRNFNKKYRNRNTTNRSGNINNISRSATNTNESKSKKTMDEGGDDDPDPDSHVKGQERGILQEAAIKASNSLGQGISSISSRIEHILFGSDKKSDEKFQKEFDDESRKELLPKLGKVLTGGAIGASISALSGGHMGLLGLFLPSGIIGASIVGIGAGLLSNNEKFMKTVFGEKDEDGKRTGGIISRKLMDSFNKAKPAIIGGAVLGALKSIFGFGGLPGPLGVMANVLLPGGPIGGAIMGMGTSLLFRSERFQKMVFGEKDEDGKRHGGFFSKMFNKFSGVKDSAKKNSKFIKGGLKGALLGGVSSAVISHMGVLGGALTIGGPIGGAIMGLGIGIASQTDKFKNYLFGTQKFDKDGNPIGREKDGLISRFGHMFNVNVIQRLKDGAEEATIRIGRWFKNDMVKPFKKAFGPVLDGIRGIKDNVSDAIHGALSRVGEGVTNVFKKAVSPIAKFARDKIFKPLAFVTSKTVKLTAAITGKLLSFPVKLLSGLLAPKRMSKFVKTGARFVASRVKNALSGTDENGNKIGFKQRMKNMGSLLKLPIEFGDRGTKTDEYNYKIKRNKTEWEVFRDKYFESKGWGSLGWHKSEEFRYDKKNDNQTLEDFKKKKAIHKQMAKYVNEDSGDESLILDNKTYQKRLRKLKKLGVDVGRINSQQDLKEAMFHYDKWASAPEEEAMKQQEIEEKAEMEIKDRVKTDEFRDGVQSNFERTVSLLEELKDGILGKANEAPETKEKSSNIKETERGIMGTAEAEAYIPPVESPFMNEEGKFIGPNPWKYYHIDRRTRKRWENDSLEREKWGTNDPYEAAFAYFQEPFMNNSRIYDKAYADSLDSFHETDKEMKETEEIYSSAMDKVESLHKLSSESRKDRDIVTPGYGDYLSSFVNASSLNAKIVNSNDKPKSSENEANLDSFINSLSFNNKLSFSNKNKIDRHDLFKSFSIGDLGKIRKFSEENGYETMSSLENDILNRINENLEKIHKVNEKTLEANLNTEQGIMNMVDPSSDNTNSMEDAIINRKNDMESGNVSDSDKAQSEIMTEATLKALNTANNEQNKYNEEQAELKEKKERENKESENAQSMSYKNKNSKKGKEYDEKNNKVLQALLKAKNAVENKTAGGIFSGLLGKLFDFGVDKLFSLGVPVLLGSLLYKLFNSDWGASLLGDIWNWGKNTTSDLMGWTDDDGSRTDYDDTIIANSGLQESTFKFMGKKVSKKVQKAFGVLGVKGNFGEAAKTLYKGGKSVAKAPIKAAGALFKGGKAGVNSIRNFMTNKSNIITDGMASKGSQGIAEAAMKNVDDFTEAGGKVANNAISKGAKIGAEATSDAAPKGVKKVLTYIKNIFKDAGDTKAVRACGTKVVKAVTKTIPDAIETTLKKPSILRKFATKISKCAIDVAKGAAKVIPVIGQIWAFGEGAWNLITGFTDSETANLFGIREDSVTFGMKVVSAAVKAILGFFSVGSIFDLVSEIVSAATGGEYDLKGWLATFIYKFFHDEEDNMALDRAQAQFDMDWEEYNKKYGTNLSKDAYNDGINQTTWDKTTGKRSLNENYKRTYIPEYSTNSLESILNKSGHTLKKQGVSYDKLDNSTVSSSNPFNESVVDANPYATNIEQAGLFPVPMNSLTGNEYGYEGGGGEAIGYGLGSKIKSGVKKIKSKSKSKVKEIYHNLNKDSEDSTSSLMDNMNNGLQTIGDYIGKLTEQQKISNENQEAQIDSQESSDADADITLDAMKDTWSEDINQFKTEIASNADTPVGTVMVKLTDIISKFTNSFSEFGVQMVDSLKKISEANIKISENLSNIVSSQNITNQEGPNDDNSDEKGGFLGGLFKATNFLSDLPIIGSLPIVGNVLNASNTIGSLMGYGNEIDKGKKKQEEYKEDKKSIGYGPNQIIHRSQYDSSYRNMPIGYKPNGGVSTMASGGCGPTSLAMAASAVTGRSYNPASIASMAVKRGYMTQGGSSSDLFDKGTKDLGLKANRISSSGIKNSLRAGKPVVLSGKSNSKGGPYSKVGHIVTATGMDSKGNVVLHDPRRRHATITSLRNLKSGFKHGWSFKNSIGYGDDVDETIKIHVKTDYEKRQRIRDIIVPENCDDVHSSIIRVLALTFNKIPGIYPNVLNSYGLNYTKISNAFTKFINNMLQITDDNILSSIKDMVSQSNIAVEKYISKDGVSVIATNSINSSDAEIADLFMIEKKYVDSNMRQCVKFITECASLPFISELIKKLYVIFDQIMNWSTISNLSIFIYNSVVSEFKKNELFKHQQSCENKLNTQDDNEKAKSRLRKNQAKLKLELNKIRDKNPITRSLRRTATALAFIGMGDEREREINNDSAYLRDIIGYGDDTAKSVLDSTKEALGRLGLENRTKREIGRDEQCKRLYGKEYRELNSKDLVKIKNDDKNFDFYSDLKRYNDDGLFVGFDPSYIYPTRIVKEKVPGNSSGAITRKEDKWNEMYKTYNRFFGNTTFDKLSENDKKGFYSKFRKATQSGPNTIYSDNPDPIFEEFRTGEKKVVTGASTATAKSGQWKDTGNPTIMDSYSYFQSGEKVLSDDGKRLEDPRNLEKNVELNSGTTKGESSEIAESVLDIKEYLKDGLYNVLSSAESNREGVMGQANALNGAIIFNQLDPAWRDFKLKNRTIGNDNGILTSLSMAFTSLSGLKITPDILYQSLENLSDGKKIVVDNSIMKGNLISQFIEKALYGKVKVNDITNNSSINSDKIRENITNDLLNRYPIMIEGHGNEFGGSGSRAILLTGFTNFNKDDEVMVNDSIGGLSRKASLSLLMSGMNKAFRFAHISPDDGMEYGLEISPSFFEWVSENGIAKFNPLNQTDEDEPNLLTKFLSLMVGMVKSGINKTDYERIYNEQGEYIGPAAVDFIGGILGLDTGDDDDKNGLIDFSTQTVPGNANMIPLDVQTKGQYIWDYFEKKGLSEVQRAGLLGNLQQETTTLNNECIDGNSRGIVQWQVGNRFDNLKKFAASKGHTGEDGWKDFKTQVEFIDHEFQNDEKAAYNKLIKTKDVRSATDAVLVGYERAVTKDPNSDPDTVGSYNWEINTRSGYAQTWYNKLHGQKFDGNGNKIGSITDTSIKNNLDNNNKLSNIVNVASDVLNITNKLIKGEKIDNAEMVNTAAKSANLAAISNSTIKLPNNASNGLKSVLNGGAYNVDNPNTAANDISIMLSAMSDGKTFEGNGDDESATLKNISEYDNYDFEGMGEEDSVTIGTEYPKYNLTDSQKSFIAGVASAEQNESDFVSQCTEISQMANLSEVSKRRPSTGAGLIKTLRSGWYAKKSVARGDRGDYSPQAMQAVEEVLVNGKRTLPRYVVEHDYYGDINNINLSPSSSARKKIKVGDTIKNNMGAIYRFYRFADGQTGGDPFGYTDAAFKNPEYKGDQPWGGIIPTGDGTLSGNNGSTINNSQTENNINNPPPNSLATKFAGILKKKHEYIGEFVGMGDDDSTSSGNLKINQQLLSIRNNTRPGKPIAQGVKKVAIHYVGNPGSSAMGNRNYFESNTDRYASSHYIVGLNGEIIQCIPENEMAYCTNAANDYSIGIENCHPGADGKFNDKTYSSLVALTKDICDRYNLNPQSDIIRHYDVNKKVCPKYYVDHPDAFQKFKNDVNSYSGGKVTNYSGGSSSGGISGTPNTKSAVDETVQDSQGLGSKFSNILFKKYDILDAIYNTNTSSSASESVDSSGGLSSGQSYNVPSNASFGERAIGYMRSINGKIAYSQSHPRNPDLGTSDCSATVAWAYNKAAGKEIFPVAKNRNIGVWSGTLRDNSIINENNAPWVQKGSLDMSKLEPGDMMLYNGHAEMYAGNGKVWNHGGGQSGNEPGPKYGNPTKSGYVGSRRLIGYGDMIEEIDGDPPAIKINADIEDEIKRIEKSREKIGMDEPCNSGSDYSVGYGGTSYEDIPKMMSSIDSELNNFNISSIGSNSEGYGDDDSHETKYNDNRTTNFNSVKNNLAEKLEVTVSTDPLERKLDVLIDVMREFVAISKTQNKVTNNYASFNSTRGGGFNPTILNTSNASSENNVNMLKSKHDLITRGKRV